MALHDLINLLAYKGLIQYSHSSFYLSLSLSFGCISVLAFDIVLDFKLIQSLS